MVFIIGLTGGIGSGKTSTANLFQELGVEVIDTDHIAYQLTRPGGSAIHPIRITFGDRFILSDGSLNRSIMRQFVFADEAVRYKLEAILHPLIYQEVLRRLPLIRSSYGMLVVPLLLETKEYFELINRVLVVDCPEALQVSRTVRRSKLQEQEVREVMAAQCSRNERLERADDVIVNDSDDQHLRQQVQILHQKYLALADKYSF